jgi:hypothetical protein
MLSIRSLKHILCQTRNVNFIFYNSNSYIDRKFFHFFTILHFCIFGICFLTLLKFF